MATRDQIWDLVAQSCMYLDSGDYDKYLALVDDGYDYAITSFSPDIRKDMVLLHVNRTELATLLGDIRHHIHLPGKLFRQASLYGVDRKQDGTFAATSYVTVTYTDEDGRSSIFCVGRYRDEIVSDGRGVRLKSRRFEMETRDLGTGCHYPI
jgi:methanesulfonate monooxygenase subunit beta